MSPAAAHRVVAAAGGRTSGNGAADGVRVALYSPDGFGLGHLRRTSLVADALRRHPAVGGVLLVTGSPVADHFPLAPGIDVVSLPAVTKDDAGAYVGASLELPLPALLGLRGRITADAFAAFRPDVVLVDHTPVGLAGELRPLLDDLQSMPSRPRLVYGMRDIIDDVDAVRHQWQQDGALEALARRYDRVLVYGDGAVETTAHELDLDRLLPGRVRHIGYVARPMPARRATPPGSLPTVLITVGGGADGAALLGRYAELLSAIGSGADFRSVIVTGPLLDPRVRHDLECRIRSTGAPVEFVGFTDHLDDLMAGAAASISMGGYNTVVELLRAGVPSLVVPRQHFRREQVLRAQRMADLGLLDWEVVEHFDVRRLRTFITGALRMPHHLCTLDLGGVGAVVDELLATDAHTVDDPGRDPLVALSGVGS